MMRTMARNRKDVGPPACPVCGKTVQLVSGQRIAGHLVADGEFCIASFVSMEFATTLARKRGKK
jgi:hypothetical protein